MHAARTGASAHDINKISWESSDFPIVCAKCLGDSAFVRMMKCDFFKECKLCERPFTVFRWQPGTHARYKNTEICQICAKLKNCCQTCMLDLEYGMNLQLRDALAKTAGVAEDAPRTGINREFYTGQVQQRVNSGEVFGGGKAAANESLLRMARSQPYARPGGGGRVCAAWIKGNCSMGDACPDRHEIPTYRNDGGGGRAPREAPNPANMEPPEDKSITTLFIGGISSNTTERQIRDTFFPFGELKSMKVQNAQRFALVTFVNRADAELAITSTFGNLVIDGQRVRVSWGRSTQQNAPGSAPAPYAAALYGAAAPLPVDAPEPIASSAPAVPIRPISGFPAAPPGGSGGPHHPPAPPPRQMYSSMDPNRLGARAGQQ